MKKVKVILIICYYFLFSQTTIAQFSADTSQVFYVCNQPGRQSNICAFPDGSNGTYSFWIDGRGSAPEIFGQHLDSLGASLWPINGKQFLSNGKLISKLQAISWNGGLLLGWVEGTAAGADSVFLNFYDLNGNSLWPQPLLIGDDRIPQMGVISDVLDIYPTSNGLLVVYGLFNMFGNAVTAWNRIDSNGLLYPVNSKVFDFNGTLFVSAVDHQDGFYIAATTYNSSGHIYVTHFDLNDVRTTPVEVDLSTVAGGIIDNVHGGLNINCDNYGDAYVVWENDSAGDIYISKITPNGTLPWGGGGEKPVCLNPGMKEYAYSMIYDDTVYVQWNDPRNLVNNSRIYMQKFNLNGDPLWTVDGIKLAEISAYRPYGKFAKAGNNIFSTFGLGFTSFKAQNVQPDGSLAWGQDGITLATSWCLSLDQSIVVMPDGSSTVFWRDNLDNICAARIRSNGALVNITSVSKNIFSVYPNPTKELLTLNFTEQLKGKAVIKIYNSLGALVVSEINVSELSNGYTINISMLRSGTYFIRIESEYFNTYSRFVVAE